MTKNEYPEVIEYIEENYDPTRYKEFDQFINKIQQDFNAKSNYPQVIEKVVDDIEEIWNKSFEEIEIEINVRGHYRTSRKGNKYYVHPYTYYRTVTIRVHG